MGPLHHLSISCGGVVTRFVVTSGFPPRGLVGEGNGIKVTWGPPRDETDPHASQGSRQSCLEIQAV